MAKKMREALVERRNKSLEDYVLDDVFETMKSSRRVSYKNGDEPSYYVLWEDVMKALTRLSNRYARFNKENKQS